MIHWAFMFICIFLSASFARAEEANSPLTWKSLQVGGIVTFQGSGNSGGGILRFNPYYQLSDRWYLGVSVDGSYQELDTRTDFFAISYLANFGYRIHERWSGQVSFGAQTWTCSGCGARFAMGSMIRRQVSPPWAPWIKDVWLQYLAVMRDPTASQALAGLGIEF